MRRLITLTIPALAIPAVALGLVLARAQGDPPPRPAETGGHRTIEVGQTCASLRERAELSCGTAAFGDTRFNCEGVDIGRCPLTRSVSVRNTGRTPVTLIVVSGPRQGERHESARKPLASGQEARLRPGSGDRLLYDIVVRAEGDGRGSIRILRVA
ncbi:hypothetical protein [Streptomyces sp. NPDC047108]|uniref:hypothetical protein n=1 Tax=Streptomyces sp. NPDC047108 TaxID=3155025 RepID=UPI0034008035